MDAVSPAGKIEISCPRYWHVRLMSVVFLQQFDVELSERVPPLDIMGLQFKVPRKPLNLTAIYYRGVQGVPSPFRQA